MGTGHGYGKVILFGEHFVVYGLPAIVSALGSRTVATVERTGGPGFELADHRLESPGYKKEKFAEQSASLENIFSAMGVDPRQTPFRIMLGGDLVAASGVGASAASCVAIARALNDEFRLGLSEEEINAIGYEGEKGYHGTPSGIDNTAAVYGGVLRFRRDLQGGPPFFEPVRIRQTFEIVEGDTGVTASTQQVVGDVRRIREEQPEFFAGILLSYEKLVAAATRAIESSGMEELGRLMNENLDLLRKIGVSSRELETLIEIAGANGALGAKITGTGRGGLMVALTPGKKSQEKVALAIEKAGFRAFRASIGPGPESQGGR